MGIPPEMRHPSSCSVLSGFPRRWTKPQVPQVVNQARDLIDFQFSLCFPPPPSSGDLGTAKYEIAGLNIAGATSSNVLVLVSNN